MKKYILISMIALLIACEEDEPKLAYPLDALGCEYIYPKGSDSKDDRVFSRCCTYREFLDAENGNREWNVIDNCDDCQ